MAESQTFELIFFRVHPSIESDILFYSKYSNGLAIWHGFPDIMHSIVNDGR